MPVRAHTRKHDLDHVPSLSEEARILMEKMAELDSSVDEYRETLHELKDDNRISPRIFGQWSINADKLLEDAKEHADKAFSTKNTSDYRFAMGWAEACIEMLNKPLSPQET